MLPTKDTLKAPQMKTIWTNHVVLKLVTAVQLLDNIPAMSAIPSLVAKQFHTSALQHLLLSIASQSLHQEQEQWSSGKTAWCAQFGKYLRNRIPTIFNGCIPMVEVEILSLCLLYV